MTIACLLIMLAATAFSALARKENPNEDANRRKASYLYIEALDAFMDENYNLYGELLTRAYDLDPSDPELTSRFGEWMLMTSSTDSAAVDKGFSMMIDAYGKKPADYFEGMQLINLASTYRRWDDLMSVSEKLHEQFPERAEVRLQLGRSYLMRALLGDTSYVRPALDVFTALEGTVGKSPQISDLKIRSMAVVNDTAAIIRELGDLSSSSPADPYTALAVAQVYNSISRPDSALVYFDRACELDSANGTAIMMRAQFYRQQGDSTTFDHEAFRAIESRDLELDTKLKLIVDYVNMLYNDTTQQPRIDKLFDTLLDVNPGETEVHRLYAEYLAHTDRFERAADQMEYAVALDGSDRSSWLYLSNMQYATKDYEKAAATLGKASNLFPDDAAMTTTRALFLAMADKQSEAIEVLEAFPDSLITDPEQLSSFYSLLGDSYYQTKNPDKAFEAYKRSLKANPFNYLAMNNIAYYYAECDTLLDDAESYALRALRHEPDNPTTLDTYAWVLYKKGDYAKAKEIIDRTLEVLHFNNTAATVDNSLKEVTEDDVQDVKAHLVKAAEDMSKENEGTTTDEAPDESENDIDASAEFLDHAGDIYFRCGNVIEAVEFWERALKHEPDNADIIKAKIKQRKIIDNDQ